MMAQTPHIYTVEEYKELDRNTEGVRYEYYDGSIRTRPFDTVRHSLICVNIMSRLASALWNEPSLVFPSDAWVQIGTTRYVHPDVTVSCDPQDARGESVRAPVVVVEVLSLDTEAFDRGDKADYYRAMPSIMEYVLIDQAQPYVQVQRRHSDSNLWAIDSYGEGDSFTLTSLNVTISVADIYRKIVFPDAAAPAPAPEGAP